MSSDFILKVVDLSHLFDSLPGFSELYFGLDHFPHILSPALMLSLGQAKHEIANKLASLFLLLLPKLQLIEYLRSSKLSLFHTKSITHNDNHNRHNKSAPNSLKQDNKSTNRRLRVIIPIPYSSRRDEDQPKRILIIGHSRSAISNWIDQSLPLS